MRFPEFQNNSAQHAQAFSAESMKSRHNSACNTGVLKWLISDPGNIAAGPPEVIQAAPEGSGGIPGKASPIDESTGYCTKR